MTRFKTRSAALLCAAVFCTGLLTFTGCSDKKDSSSAVSSEDDGMTIDLNDENLEYGATLRTDKGNFSLPLQFDKRFFTDEALTTLSSYYYSIQTNDVALFNSVQQDFYHDYVIGEVYKDAFTDEELVKQSHDTWVERMNGEYAYALIYVTDCITEKVEYSNIPTVKNMLDEAAKKADQPAISDKIQTMYELTVDLYLTEADSGETGEVGTHIENTVLFLYEYEDNWYVVY